MLTLRSFAEKKPLYSETYSQYGPAYYLLTEPLHSVLGLPLSLHGVRFKTALIWAAVVILTMGIVHRISGNRVLALFSSCMVAIHLSRLALEPGHPQEISLLMSMLTLWLVCDKSSRRWWLAGCCASLCGMCKLNVGLVLTMPLLLVATVMLPKIKFVLTGIIATLWMIVTLAIGATMLPKSLSNIAFFCLIAMLGSWGSLCWVALKSERAKSGAGALLGTTISGLFVSMCVVLWTLLSGTSPSMLAWGIVGQHVGFARTFFQPISVDLFAITCGALVAVCYRSRKALGIASFLCLAVAVLKTASTSISPLTLQIQNASEWLAIIGPCFAPALLLYRKRLLRGRVMLAGMTAIGPWIAFPIPGTQLMLGTLPAWLTLGIVASDGIQSLSLAVQSPDGFSNEKLKWDSYSRLLFASSFVVGLLSSLLSTAKWIGGESLAFAGSEWIRIESSQAKLEQKLVREIQQTGATHLVFDGHTINRLYFWTGLKPLTDANATLWPYMLSQKELKALGESVEQSHTLCVAVPPDVPRPLDDASLQSKTRQSLYDRTVFHFKDPSGWSIGIRE